MPVETFPDDENTSQTLCGVAIICGRFVLETAQITRGRSNLPTLAVLAVLEVLAAVFVWSVVMGIVSQNCYKAQSAR